MEKETNFMIRQKYYLDMEIEVDSRDNNAIKLLGIERLDPHQIVVIERSNIPQLIEILQKLINP